MTTIAEQQVEQQIEAFAERLFGSALGVLDLIGVYLGEQLGLYEALTDGPATPPQLAARAGIAERYAQEWLEQQAVSGILTLEEPSDDPAKRVFSLPQGHAIVLTDSDSLAYLGLLGRFITVFGRTLPKVVEAYRTGGGVSWAEYGDDVRIVQEAFNKNWYLQALGAEWFPAITDVHERLSEGGMVADLGAGAGWSSIAIAEAYPAVQVHGFDNDEASVALARRNAVARGVDDRVTFEVRDASDPKAKGHYDLVAIFEALHDMSQPIEALRRARELLTPDGTVIVMDEAAAERFEAPSENPLEAFFYGASIALCLPNALAEEGAIGTGTAMRPSTVREYATQAGYREVEILPIEHPMFRFYRLHV